MNLRNRIRNHLRKFLSNSDGSTAVEYGLLTGFMTIIMVAFMTDVGTTIDGILAPVIDIFNSALGSL